MNLALIDAIRLRDIFAFQWHAAPARAPNSPRHGIFPSNDPSQQLGGEHDAGHNGSASFAKHSNILAKISLNDSLEGK
ncbi:hypothetical protein JQ597_37040 [Bradyrhizobium sp. AUGA SZCCT0177]|nr:hypothetical protein [Bradyrhizobium sp. AUGA SZCCT0177]